VYSLRVRDKTRSRHKTHLRVDVRLSYARSKWNTNALLLRVLFHLTLIERVSIFIEGHTPDRDIQQTTVLILIPIFQTRNLISYIHRLLLCTQQ